MRVRVPEKLLGGMLRPFLNGRARLTLDSDEAYYFGTIQPWGRR